VVTSTTGLEDGGRVRRWFRLRERKMMIDLLKPGRAQC